MFRKNTVLRTRILAGTAIVGFAFAGLTSAQSYPDKVIKFIVDQLLSSARGGEDGEERS